MSFFERYFAALDGPDPHSSLELVAETVEFTIQCARGTDRARSAVIEAIICGETTLPLRGSRLPIVTTVSPGTDSIENRSLNRLEPMIPSPMPVSET